MLDTVDATPAPQGLPHQGRIDAPTAVPCFVPGLMPCPAAERCPSQRICSHSAYVLRHAIFANVSDPTGKKAATQITGAADDNCSETLTPPGSAATGCAWSEASAYAAAFALADVHSAAAAAAFAKHCTPRCAADEATSWTFAQPETMLLVFTSAYAAATDAACAAGAPPGGAPPPSSCIPHP